MVRVGLLLVVVVVEWLGLLLLFVVVIVVVVVEWLGLLLLLLVAVMVVAS